ncbi:hypothetical protein E2C01_079866 [Portunus trituberculatus]|uniref:Uncharacterized protein n=1 Tax=Portunus trituberculatus TaxID=210409 RepID=A0A5B7IUG2_PORTR|nr:hypothetical protein [Portunus trituberculatus]
MVNRINHHHHYRRHHRTITRAGCANLSLREVNALVMNVITFISRVRDAELNSSLFLSLSLAAPTKACTNGRPSQVTPRPYRPLLQLSYVIVGRHTPSNHSTD